MRYEGMHEGMYVVRTRDLAWARKLSGVICHVEGIDEVGNLLLRITEDCVPKGNVLKVSDQANDNCWYDISDLVYEASSAITPPMSMCSYASTVEANYRNFIGMGGMRGLLPEQAIGKVCVIGEPNSKYGAIFSKTGYYVVGCDVNGYTIVYSGFCEYSEDSNKRRPTLQVLNFAGTDRAFYPANEIVTACHAAYEEDCNLASSYRNKVMADVVATGTEITEEGNVPLEALKRMQLGRE